MCLPARSTRSLLTCALLLGLLVGLAGPVSAAPQYDWPLQPRPVVTEQFDPPAKRWLPGHRGVDLAATEGQPVLAAGDGVVAFAGTVAGKPVVSVDHGSIRTTYEPVVAVVSAGQSVSKGEVLGTVQAGHEGCARAVCVHWGAKRGDVYLDPLSLLQPRVVRLLPL
jgi:murein DD-endopeptidase MepM/ murein hydrolase activator NlpD